MDIYNHGLSGIASKNIDAGQIILLRTAAGHAYHAAMQIVHPLRAWRKSKGLNQRVIADLVGVSAAQISLIETGRRAPSLSLATRIERMTNRAIRAAELSREEAA